MFASSHSSVSRSRSPSPHEDALVVAVLLDSSLLLFAEAVSEAEPVVPVVV